MASIKRRPSKSVQVVYGNQEVTLSYRGNYNEFVSNVSESFNLAEDAPDTREKSGKPGIVFRAGDQELVGATALDNFVQEDSSPITQLFVYSAKNGTWQSTSAFISAKDPSSSLYYGRKMFKIACYVSIVFGSLLVIFSFLYLSIGINVFHKTYWKGPFLPCKVGDARTYTLEEYCNFPPPASGFEDISNWPLFENDTLDARGILMCETLGREVWASLYGIVFGVLQILVAAIFIKNLFKEWNLLILIVAGVIFVYANVLTFTVILDVVFLWRRLVPLHQRRLSPLHTSFFNVPPEPTGLFSPKKYCGAVVATIKIIKTVVMIYMSWTIINGLFNFGLIAFILGVFARRKWNLIVNGPA